MPTFQVTCSELVHVDRTYEVDAEDGTAAWEMVEKQKGGENMVDEQMQCTQGFCGVIGIHDENGNEVVLQQAQEREPDERR